ncbi:MAG: prolyl oligopeptidase family serine peptidase [Ktedonobacteraceae bacterium]|nr:prolyl oligopeptidase family serine peptidase [Ktedonobacteraceae bacterium]MBO0791478.1 prolyl oligopeptidase family serine peptidase [Ktedonobacteraceae bacterium]
MESMDLRHQIITCLGHFPERVEPSTKVESVEELDGYTRTRITYMVEPGERIAAWLLVPGEHAPREGWPAILTIHQHGGQFDQGKSEPAGLSGRASYHYGVELCQRGYVVLCPDQLCFGERRPPEEVRLRHNGMLEKKGYEQFEFTRRILSGSCLQTKYLHDLSCGLDVLAAQPDVDADRLGVIGHSLGGQETLWLTWYDQRVRVGVSSCGFGTIQTILRDGITHNFALYVPGLLEVCDMDALLAGIAPRPFLLTAGEADPIFPIDGVRTIIAKAREAYTQAGAADRLRAIIFPDGHSFPDEVKAEAYSFLDRWLK